MRWSLRLFLLLPALTCLLACASFAALAGGDDWRAVDPAELALKTSTVEKDADAEALFWEVRVDDQHSVSSSQLYCSEATLRHGAEGQRPHNHSQAGCDFKLARFDLNKGV